MMRRRAFIAGAGAALVAPRLVRAQAKVPLVAVVFSGTRESQAPQLARLVDGLRQAGWRDGDNVALAVRYADGNGAAAPEIVRDVVALSPALVVTSWATAVAEFVAARSPIPMVIGGGIDASQYFGSQARPGGGITGLSADGAVLWNKRIELAKELVPAARKLGCLFPVPQNATNLGAIEAAARTVSVGVAMADVGGDVNRIDDTFAQLLAQGIDAMVTHHGGALAISGPRIAELARRYRVPTVVGTTSNMGAGVLASVGVEETYPLRTAYFADRILRGTDPALLPVELQDVHVVINVASAREFGLPVPLSVLVRADEVIE